ncbi:hypothetical protein HZC30_07845 [Candidatus Woesearchaeota archaeon]|nr:hypothetical protein [Candidatus Woesearchaeota archaeon]
MTNNLKRVIQRINPFQLGVTSIQINSFRKLGLGEGHLNYQFIIGNKKFLCRVNIDKNVPNQSKEEYYALKLYSMT